MNRAIHSTAIAGLLVFLISATQALVTPISNCTTISQPGSYIVSNNIAATPSNIVSGGVKGLSTCILIRANFVTLDLAGFEITGRFLTESGVGCTNAENSPNIP